MQVIRIADRLSTIRRRQRIALVVVLSFFATAANWAVPPIAPLPVPNYSFKLNSPSLDGPDLDAAAILRKQGIHARVAVTSAESGLTDPMDDVDALSSADLVMWPDSFILLYSVDEQTLGTTWPDPVAVEEEVPFNTTDQQARGHQAGDLYMSCTTFENSGSEAGALPQVGTTVSNNVLVVNNYDEGGVDFGALPATSADDSLTTQSSQDVVDAVAYLETTSRFFSLSATSPSLFELATDGSGADVFHINGDTNTVSQFADAVSLGLTIDDDIDALIVFDTNSDGAFGFGDYVFFSLTPSSPSLYSIDGASLVGGGADVFIARHDLPPSVLATAVMFGLGSATDNIDGLELDECESALSYAAEHGIRAPASSSSENQVEPAQGVTGGNGRGRQEGRQGGP